MVGIKDLPKVSDTSTLMEWPHDRFAALLVMEFSELSIQDTIFETIFNLHIQGFEFKDIQTS
jgi:hypothetical protein